jgi:drug/metabolite transporter (DMT)-like permease
MWPAAWAWTKIRLGAPRREGNALLSYFLAVLAACANATSSVLQRKANKEVPQKENLSWKLIQSLLHQPIWFFGILAITVGFLLQASALGAGELAVVEPILVLELPFTLILASRVFRSGMGAREWGSILAMTAGLAGLLYFLSPTAGRSDEVHLYIWLIGIGANLALVGVLVLWGRRGPAGRGGGAQGSGAHQAAVFGIAGGSAFGLTAALMKGMTTYYSQGGFGAIFTSWQLYAMVASGALGMFLVQSALNAGKLIAAQPGLSLSDPIISILWGVLAFHERVRGGPIHLLMAALSTAVLAAAVVVLARSPLLSDDQQQGTQDGQSRRRPGDQPQSESPHPARS